MGRMPFLHDSHAVQRWRWRMPFLELVPILLPTLAMHHCANRGFARCQGRLPKVVENTICRNTGQQPHQTFDQARVFRVQCSLPFNLRAIVVRLTAL